MKKILVIILIILCMSSCVFAQSYPNNYISFINSTTTPLDSVATFTGKWEDVSNYTSITVFVRSDKASATSGLKFQFSSNKTNGDNFAFATYAANDTLTNAYTISVKARYFRVVYVNTTSDQTYFRLQTIFAHGSVLNSYFTGTIGAVTQSGTWNINNISGTISLPTGASTATNQSTQITRADTLNARASRSETKLGQIYTRQGDGNQITKFVSYTSGGYGTFTAGTGADTLSGSSVTCAKVTLMNASAGKILYYGFNGSVTTSNGMGALGYLDSVTLEVSNLNKVYLISDSATTDVRYSYLNY